MIGEGNRPKRHRLFVALAALFGLPVAVALAYFLWQTGVYFVEIKSGGASIADRRLAASISSLVANANVTPADLARLVPIAGLYPELGNPNARVVVVEFIDYQCPFCQKTAPVVRKLMGEFGGRVRFIVRDFPITELHPGAKQSALAANCVLEQGQEAYWKYHDLLFNDVQNQDSASLRARAEAVGARMDDFDACVAQERYLKKIDADIQTALQTGVQGTPTFFIIADRKAVPVQGAQDEKTLTRVINAVMEELPN